MYFKKVGKIELFSCKYGTIVIIILVYAQVRWVHSGKIALKFGNRTYILVIYFMILQQNSF